MERFRTLGGSDVLLPYGLRAEPDRPAPLDLARCHPDPARKLERRLDLGGTEHSFELRTHPHCTALCANPFATSRLGRLRSPRLRTFGGTADSGRRLSITARRDGCGRCSAYTNACMSTADRLPTWTAQSKARTARARDDREHGPNAPAGLLCRGGRLRLAGTKGILVSPDPIRRLHSWVGVLSPSLCLFLRGPSRIQPPEAMADVLRFIGRRTLEIYAIQLAGSELVVKLILDLAP